MVLRFISACVVALAATLLGLVGAMPAAAASPVPVVSGHGRAETDDTTARIDLRAFKLGPYVFDVGTANAGLRAKDGSSSSTCLPIVWGIRLVRALPKTVTFDCVTINTGPHYLIPIFKLEHFSLVEGVGAHPGYLRFVGDYQTRFEANAAAVAIRLATTSTLAVDSNPPGARIYVDGFDTGHFTGCTEQLPGQSCVPGTAVIDVASGHHTLRLVKDGHEPVEASVVVPVGGEASVTLDLPALVLPGPDYAVEVVADDLAIPWDIAFASDGVMLFTERPEGLNARMPDGQIRVLAQPDDLLISWESGMMSLALDPDFDTNRQAYTCQGHALSNSVQIVRWTIAPDYTSAERDLAPVLGGIPASADGRHVGCRIRFDATGHLLVGTGDAFVGTNAQDLASLGGKTLRIDTTSGEGALDNPFATETNPNTRRIFTYGHRNVQGLALRPGSGTGTSNIYAVEHGPTWDDEVNHLVPGGNYGWNPVPGYNEAVPMTDLALFPDAIEAIWDSGEPTIAASGGAFIEGAAWGAWDRALVLGALKTTHLRVVLLDAAGEVIGETTTLTGYGRLRSPVMGPDGSLYVTTSNGANVDKILKLTPTP